MSRWLLAVMLSACVAGLLVWQHRRERAIAACISHGGIWNGPRSSCEPAPPRPILQRDLQRS